MNKIHTYNNTIEEERVFFQLIAKCLIYLVPIMMDSYGNRMYLIHEQRNPIKIHPHRSMMITGVYHPMHNRELTMSKQTTKIFPHGNSVSSNAYLSTNVSKYHRRNPEAIDELETPSAEFEAPLKPYDAPITDEKQNHPGIENKDEEMHDDRHIQPHQVSG